MYILNIVVTHMAPPCILYSVVYMYTIKLCVSTNTKTLRSGRGPRVHDRYEERALAGESTGYVGDGGILREPLPVCVWLLPSPDRVSLGLVGKGMKPDMKSIRIY